MPQAEDVLLSAMTALGHAPRPPPPRNGNTIRTECRRCGLAGVVYVDSAGKYIENSVQGEGVWVKCPSRRGRLGESPSSP
jgi:hypothetical protein